MQLQIGLYEIVLFVLSFKTEFAVENVPYEIVPGQVKMTKNDITWHYTREWRIQDLPNRGRPRRARSASLYNGAHSGSSWQLGSPIGDHGGSPEAGSLMFILYKRGVRS